MNGKVIAVDLDFTIYRFPEGSKYDTKLKMSEHGTPIKENIDFLINLKEKYKCKLIIWSSRWWGDYNKVKEWLDEINFPYDDIVLGRFKADCYFCDRAVNSINFEEEEVVKKLTDNII
ncbi:hypothetical protein LCGC14_2173960 [marine sediment metagenome]|uniref:FCP1 homology domain-containing protein n=1 Tax=marine sediment metagenome TaxID=412755 RepID=A0A0F9DP49_9ZZZZ